MPRKCSPDHDLLHSLCSIHNSLCPFGIQMEHKQVFVMSKTAETMI